MATKRYTGNAQSTKQVDSFTPANVNIGNVFTLTCNGKTVSYTAAAATVADVIAGLLAILNHVSTFPAAEFFDVVWSDGTTYLKATSRVAGLPFTITSGATGGTATFTQATLMASSGPGDPSKTANWSGGSLPVATDTIVFENSTVDLLGIDQSGVAVASVKVLPSWLGKFGLPEINAGIDGVPNSGGYDEYRETYVRWGINVLDYQGRSRRAKFDMGNSGSPASCRIAADLIDARLEQGVPMILIKGGHVTNTVAVEVVRGDVAFAFYAGETFFAATFSAGYLTLIDDDAVSYCGSGVTFNGGIQIYGGDTTLNGCAGVSTIKVGAGTLTTKGNFNISGTIVNRGGIINHNAVGTVIVEYAGYGGGTLNLEQRGAQAGNLFTQVNLYAGTIVYDVGGRMVSTNSVSLVGCRLDEVTWRTPRGIDLTVDYN